MPVLRFSRVAGIIASITIVALSTNELALAESRRFVGSIDNHYAINMLLDQKAQVLTGTYSYGATGKPLNLKGTVDTVGKFVLEEFDGKGTKTGKFTGQMLGGNCMTGVWAKANAAKDESPLPCVIAVEGNKQALAGGKNGVIITEKIRKISKPKRESTPDDATAKVSYPIVATNMLDNDAAAKTLQSSLAPAKIYGDSIEKMASTIKSGDLWLWETLYQIDYNRNYLLDGDFTISGSAAYPSSSTKHLLLNTKTGLPIKVSDAFNAASLTQLRALVNKKTDAEIAATIKEHASESEDAQSLKEQFTHWRSPAPEN